MHVNRLKKLIGNITFWKSKLLRDELALLDANKLLALVVCRNRTSVVSEIRRRCPGPGKLPAAYSFAINFYYLSKWQRCCFIPHR